MSERLKRSLKKEAVIGLGALGITAALYGLPKEDAKVNAPSEGDGHESTIMITRDVAKKALEDAGAGKVSTEIRKDGETVYITEKGERFVLVREGGHWVNRVNFVKEEVADKLVNNSEELINVKDVKGGNMEEKHLTPANNKIPGNKHSISVATDHPPFSSEDGLRPQEEVGHVYRPSTDDSHSARLLNEEVNVVTPHGSFSGVVEGVTEDHVIVNGKKIPFKDLGGGTSTMMVDRH